MSAAPLPHPTNDSAPPSAERRMTTLLILFLLLGPGAGSINPADVATCVFDKRTPGLEQST